LGDRKDRIVRNDKITGRDFGNQGAAKFSPRLNLALPALHVAVKRQGMKKKAIRGDDIIFQNAPATSYDRGFNRPNYMIQEIRKIDAFNRGYEADLVWIFAVGGSLHLGFVAPDPDTEHLLHFACHQSDLLTSIL
jgi:hypothetical protein